MNKKIISYFSSKVLALNDQQAKFFVVISRERLFILTPLFKLNGPPLLAAHAVPTDQLFSDLGPVSRKSKAICENANSLFWKTDLLTYFQDNKKKNDCEV